MKKILKKILRISAYIFIGLCVLLVLAELSLRYILPSQSVKTKTLAYLSQTTGADIKTDKISASIFGINLNNVSANVSGEDLFNCKKLQIRLNPFMLLIGRLDVKAIIIQEPFVKIVRKQDGTFNFDPLLSAEDKPEENTNSGELSVPFDIRIKNLTINKALVSYVDLKENIKADLKNLHFNLNRFSFYKPFSFAVSFNPYFEQTNMVFDGANFGLNAAAELKKLNLPDAAFYIKNMSFDYKDTSFVAQAEVHNFENPSGHIKGRLSNLSDNTLAEFTEVVPFNIPSITTDLSFNYFIKDAKANIKDLTVSLVNTTLKFKANLDLNKNEISEGKINITSILDDFTEVSPLIEELKPTGQANADFNFAWPIALAGNLTLTDVGLVSNKAGTLEKLNTKIDVKSIDEINIDSLTGILNKNPFTMKANYMKKEKFADVFFDLKADKFYVFNTSPKESKSEEKGKQTPAENKPQTVTVNEGNNFSFVPINVNAKVDIKKLDVPFIKGNNLVFKAKAKNITTQMDKTHGTFDLSIKNGQIKDIYTISNANAITKVMFMSLGIVSKVVNTLNVLDLLNGMGKVLSGNKEEEEELPVHQEINGKMDFDSFNTNIDFNQGLATMKKCSFVSSLFSFRVNGNINFDNRKIKLNVDSAPGRHTDNGIMPLNIDVKGTIEDPKGSLSVLSSVADLVGHTITKNPVSNMLKSTWGALFKSKEPEEEEEITPASPEEDKK